ncbi:MAG: PEGA domain-containing protein [Myxococcota bacterium]
MWLFMTVALTASVGHASGEAEEAEVTFNLGARAYVDGNYEEALAQFLASNRLAPNASVAFNIARCYARLDKYAEAFRWFTLAGEGLSDPKVQRAVQDELKSITPKVVVYDITSDPPGATVYNERKDLGIVGVTPFRIAQSPSSEPRTFLFERDGYESTEVSGVRGGRGETVPVTTSLVQVVGTVAFHAPEGTVVHQGAPDGPVVCEAPCDEKFAPGNWVFYFHKDGFRDALRQLEVVRDQTTTTLVELAPNTGSIVVDATERGALVEVDGKAAGFTPAVLQGVAVGPREVRVSRPGYEPVVIDVEVETDKQVSLDDLELLPLNEISAVSRRLEKIELAPSSVTVIGQEELKAFRYPTIYEALRGVRGFALTYDGVYGGTNVRGIGQANDFNNRILLLTDGAVLNDNFYLQSFISYDSRTDLGGIERIEVVRGPGSVLYGTGAFSGVVNLVTESLDAPQGTTVEVGTFDNAVLRARAQAHYKLSDGIGFRASVSAGMSPGREEDVDPRGAATDELTLSGFDKWEGATTHGRIWLKDLTVQWFHAWRDIHIPTGVYFTNYNDERHVWTDARSLFEARYEPQLSEAVKLYTRAYLYRSYYDATLPYGNIASVESTLGVATGAELRVQAEVGEKFRATIGSLAEHSPTAHVHGEDQKRDGTVLDTYVEVNQPYTVLAGYGVFDIIPVESVRLTLGARADYWTTFGSAISPRAALILIPKEGNYLKIMGGRAFRAPSIYEFAYDAPFQIKPTELLKPETVWSGEVEYTHAFDEAWTGLVAGHASYVEDLITTVDAGPGAVTYTNSNEPLRIGGLDFELRRGFQGGWMVSGFYSLLDSRTEGGELVPNAPIHNAGAKLIVPVSAPAARVAFRASLDAPRRIDTTREDYTGWAVVADLVLSGMVPERGFEYGVGLYNLFDQKYREPVIDNYPFRTVPQQGRSLMATLSMRF